jgi:hypothetical protein
MSNPPFKRDDDAEWSKVITAVLIKGSTIICFDNVDGLLRSPSLASAITGKVYSGRILGFSKTVEIPVNVSWFVNGNNIQLGGDLPRRCYWIRLDAKMSRPWERKGFKHKDLGAWVMENRVQLIAAILTMAKAWFVAGCPKPNIPKLGSFESWCDTVGGILQFAGITDFLGNQENMYELSDVEGQEWEMFLLAWQERYQDNVVLVKELLWESPQRTLSRGQGKQRAVPNGSVLPFLELIPKTRFRECWPFSCSLHIVCPWSSHGGLCTLNNAVTGLMPTLPGLPSL